MKALLDTNIVIHRETDRIVKENIGTLFYWLDKLQYTKNVHPITVNELNRYWDKEVVRTISIKLESYQVLNTVALLHSDVKRVSDNSDITDNNKNDTLLLNEVYCSRVDLLITEDKKYIKKLFLLELMIKCFELTRSLKKHLLENPPLI